MIHLLALAGSITPLLAEGDSVLGGAFRGAIVGAVIGGIVGGLFGALKLLGKKGK